jgi:hypothetical protein
LLSPPPSTPSVSLNAIGQIAANCAVLLGGNAALSSQVATQVAGALVPGGCGVDRIGGANRYETAALIASRFQTVNGPAGQVILVSGVEFPDALTAAPLAGGNRPMLLTGPTQLPDATAAWLRANRNSLTRIMVVGGTGVIPSIVVNQAIAAAAPTPGPGPGPNPPPPDGSWPVQAGGADSDEGYSISALADGSGAIVTGSFRGEVDFGSTTLDADGGGDNALFVAKIDTSGNWVWAVGAGDGTDDAVGRGVVTLADGSAIIVGYFFESITFDADDTVSESPITLTGDQYQILVAKVNASGKWEWANASGATGRDFGYGIALAGDTVIVTGSQVGKLYLARRRIDTGAAVWQTALDGGSSAGYAVSALANGSAIITGECIGVLNEPALTCDAEGDVFIGRIDPAGFELSSFSWAWVAKVSGPGFDVGRGVSILSDDGSAIVTGSFEGAGTTFTPSTGSISLTAVGFQDGFIAKIDASGQWLWAAQVAAASAANASAAVTLADDSAIVTGQISGAATFNSVGPASIPLTNVGSRDLFVAKIDSSGNWVWASGAGGAGGAQAQGSGVTVLLSGSSSGRILVTGTFEGTVSFGTESRTSDDESEDVFVARLSATGTFG